MADEINAIPLVDLPAGAGPRSAALADRGSAQLVAAEGVASPSAVDGRVVLALAPAPAPLRRKTKVPLDALRINWNLVLLVLLPALIFSASLGLVALALYNRTFYSEYISSVEEALVEVNNFPRRPNYSLLGIGTYGCLIPLLQCLWCPYSPLRRFYKYAVVSGLYIALVVCCLGELGLYAVLTYKAAGRDFYGRNFMHFSMVIDGGILFLLGVYMWIPGNPICRQRTSNAAPVDAPVIVPSLAINRRPDPDAALPAAPVLGNERDLEAQLDQQAPVNVVPAVPAIVIAAPEIPLNAGPDQVVSPEDRANVHLDVPRPSASRPHRSRRSASTRGPSRSNESNASRRRSADASSSGSGLSVQHTDDGNSTTASSSRVGTTSVSHNVRDTSQPSAQRIQDGNSANAWSARPGTTSQGFATTPMSQNGRNTSQLSDQRTREGNSANASSSRASTTPVSHNTRDTSQPSAQRTRDGNSANAWWAPRASTATQGFGTTPVGHNNRNASPLSSQRIRDGYSANASSPRATSTHQRFGPASVNPDIRNASQRMSPGIVASVLPDGFVAENFIPHHVLVERERLIQRLEEENATLQSQNRALEVRLAASRQQARRDSGFTGHYD